MGCVSVQINVRLVKGEVANRVFPNGYSSKQWRAPDASQLHLFPCMRNSVPTPFQDLLKETLKTDLIVEGAASCDRTHRDHSSR